MRSYLDLSLHGVSGVIIKLLLSLLFIFAGSVRSENVLPILTLRTLNTQLANKIVVAAVADCSKRGYKVAASLVSRDGHLLAFLRHPLSGPHTVAVSQQKAYSAASFQASTGSMRSRSDLHFAPGILLILGGVPIEAGGHFYGGVAVSGAEPEIDEKCALAGIEQVREVLEFAD